jgi:hypothetical protein
MSGERCGGGGGRGTGGKHHTECVGTRSESGSGDHGPAGRRDAELHEVMG